MKNPKYLAWHETLELHEIVAFSAVNLIAFKEMLPTVKDPELRALYTEAVRSLETGLPELLAFYPATPAMNRSHKADDVALLGAEFGHLLGYAKTSVRNLAIAITETATPELRAVFHKHLDACIAFHAKVFHHMHERGLYPSYNLEQLLANDVKLAQQALSM
ncbi:spore coat protein [Paenibacillus sp. TRM 82003]|nr:spore coat protein [Paenibacillus sp. TRM 82003]